MHKLKKFYGVILHSLIDISKCDQLSAVHVHHYLSRGIKTSLAHDLQSTILKGFAITSKHSITQHSFVHTNAKMSHQDDCRNINSTTNNSDFSAADELNNNHTTNSRRANTSSGRCNVVLVACGSFNPITNMHLRMFELARDHLHKNHPHYSVTSGYLSPVCDAYGKAELVSGVHRLKMCQIAVKSNPWIQVKTWELQQDNWTPTVDVLKHYEEEVCAESCDSTTKVMLLCGADFLETFLTKGLWLESNIRKIIEDFGLVVITRPSYDPCSVINKSDLLFELQSNIYVVPEWVINDVSSTKVRQAIRRKQSIRYLIPDDVVDYVYKHKLYSGIPSTALQELAPFKRFKS